MARTSTATDAVEAYRRSLLTDDVEARITELADAVAAHDANEASRQRDFEKLTASKWWSDEESLSTFLDRARAIAEKGWADQDAVLAAFDAAKAAGAKPSALHEAGLRPDSVLAAARGRAKNTAPQPTQARNVTAETTAATDYSATGDNHDQSA